MNDIDLNLQAERIMGDLFKWDSGGVRIWIRDGAYKEARCIGMYACMDIIVYDHSTVKKGGKEEKCVPIPIHIPRLGRDVIRVISAMINSPVHNPSHIILHKNSDIKHPDTSTVSPFPNLSQYFREKKKNMAISC